MHGFSRSGFTLVELSIVLVILGLLVGGVLSGQSLIHAAELRAVTTEKDRWLTATHTFRDKYLALPGDMTNATAFWGAIDPDRDVCSGLPSTNGSTCNGDGDGQVEKEHVEGLHYWIQLRNAGLIEGNYTGIDPDSSTVPGISYPLSRYSGGAWNLTYVANGEIEGLFGNLFFLGAGVPGSYLPETPLLTPQDTYMIDRKVDDGDPFAGIMQSRKYVDAANCVTAADDGYQLDHEGVGCRPVFYLGF